jgi:hypothetical protein
MERPREIFTPEQAAEYLQVDRETIYRNTLVNTNLPYKRSYDKKSCPDPSSAWGSR